MLKTRIGDTEVSFSVGFPATVALLCACDKTGSAALCLYAALLHESAHIGMTCACGFRPRALCFGAFGMRLELPPLPYRKMAAVALSGPLCNLLFAGISAACQSKIGLVVHLALGGFNLLPLTPLDGGQALFCLLAPRFGEQAAEKTVTLLTFAAGIPLLAAGVFVLAVTGYNLSLLLLCVYLVFLLFLQKKD